MWKIAAGTAAAAIVCLARSEYERKALAVETVEITSEKIKSSRRVVFLQPLIAAVRMQCCQEGI